MGSIIRDYTVEDLSLIDSTKEQCQELCWLALKNKGWKDRSKITAKMLGDGLTNHLFKCEYTGERVPEHDLWAVIVRIFGQGTEALIDRDHEISVMKSLSDSEIIPQFVGRFRNGIVVEFAPGSCLAPLELRHPSIIPLVAEKMALLHEQVLPAKKEARLWSQLDEWLTEGGAHSLLKIVDCLQAFNKSPDWEMAQFDGTPWGLSSVREAAASLRKECDRLSQRLVCCHNDINAYNIIVDRRKHTIDSVSLIDFEYCHWNHPAFDVGNYFCEWAGVGASTECDFERYYPTQEEQNIFASAYLKESKSDMAAAEFLKEANCYAMASHLYWGTWAVVQSQISELEFDFLAYGRKRFASFYKNRLQMTMPPGSGPQTIRN